MGIEAIVARLRTAAQALDGSKKEINALKEKNLQQDAQLQGYVVALVQSEGQAAAYRAEVAGLQYAVEAQQGLNQAQEAKLADIEGFLHQQIRLLSDLQVEHRELHKLFASVLDLNQSEAINAYQLKANAPAVQNPFGLPAPQPLPRHSPPPKYQDVLPAPQPQYPQPAPYQPQYPQAQPQGFAPYQPQQYGQGQPQFTNPVAAAGVYIVQQAGPQQPGYSPSWQAPGAPAPTRPPMPYVVDNTASKAEQIKAGLAAKEAKKLSEEDAKRRAFQANQAALGHQVQATLYAKQIQIDELKGKFNAIMSEAFKKALNWVLDINTAKQYIIDHPVPDQKIQAALVAVFPQWPNFETAYKQWRWTDEGRDFGARCASLAGDVYEELQKLGVENYYFNSGDFAKLNETLQDPELNKILWTPEDQIVTRPKKTVTPAGATYQFSVGGDRIGQIIQFAEILEEQERIEPRLGKISKVLMHPPI